jgi:hypothetical protein
VREEQVADAAGFERSRGLLIFELEVDLAAGVFGEGGGVDEGGVAPGNWEVGEWLRHFGSQGA